MKSPYTLITGASAGIGKELAIVCAGKGYNLLLVSLPGSDLAGLAADLCKHYGIKVHYYELDLTVPGASRQLFEWCSSKGYLVDKLINNVGMGSRGKFEKQPLDNIQSMILLNTYVFTSITHLFIPLLKQHPKAYILNVSSTASFFNIPFKAVYSATKAFVNSFSTSLRNELANTNIRVSVLCPGGSMHKRDPQVESKINKKLSNIIHESPASIARAGIHGMLAEKRMILPGIVSKLYVFVSRLIPAGITDPIVRRIFAPATERGTSHLVRKRKLTFWSLAIAAWLVIILLTSLL